MWAKQVKLQKNMDARTEKVIATPESSATVAHMQDVDMQGNDIGDSRPPVMDYEGSQYRTDFWVGQSRQYEDAVERLALQSLLPAPRLPAQGGRIAEIGAGFGRLADLYLGYRQIILFDYSRTLLREAAERWGDDPRFIFVAGNLYDLPLANGVLDALVMVRVMHHLVDVPRALSQLRRVLHPESVAVVEYANKRNAKAMARWMLGRQEWSPIEQTPIEFVKLNFDFHPAWMRDRLAQAHLRVRRQWAVSHFRLPILKRLIPAERLAALEERFFALGGKFPLSPSVFLQLAPVTADAYASVDGAEVDSAVNARLAQGGPGENIASLGNGQQDNLEQEKRKQDETDLDDITQLFCCPSCFAAHSFDRPNSDRLVCRVCDAAYARVDGIWDFKEAL